jgi:hypothetical protein
LNTRFDEHCANRLQPDCCLRYEDLGRWLVGRMPWVVTIKLGDKGHQRVTH